MRNKETILKGYFKNKLSFILLSSIFLFFFSNLNAVVYAQQSLEMGSGSATNASDDPDSNNSGPTTEVTFPLLHNIDNPSDDVFTDYLPELTATITISNQQYSTTQDTDDDDSDGGGGTDDAEFTLGGFTAGDNPASTIGWNNNSQNGGGTFIRFGEAVDDVRLFNSISQSTPTSSNYASLESLGDGTTGSGISVADNYAVYLASNFEALRGQIVGLDGGSPSRFYVADLTITFNQPVNDPILHFLGLGGRWFVTLPDDPVAGESTTYINSATIELELVTASSSAVNSFSKLSGTSHFEVDDGNKLIRNNADVPDVDDTSTLPDDFGVGSGSALIDGDGITTLVFNMYARGMNIAETRYTDADGTTDIVVANEDLNWAGNGGSPFPDLNFSSDSWMMSISTQVDPDDALLTTAECYRMMSAPVDGTTYGTLLDPIWTQGIIGADDNNDPSSDPNVWLWPDVPGTSDTGWTGLSDLGNTIPPGSGFLVSVYSDDDYDGTPEGFDKTLSVTGSENAPLTFTNMNSDASGWTLLGNPFKSPLHIATANDGIFEGTTQDVVETVYIWDRNTEGGDGGDNSTDNLPGSWITGTSGGGGDIFNDDGTIAPFQGFFVQNNGANPQVDFRNASKAANVTFYGKENKLANFARFELNGEGLYNSMWVQFSNEGSLDMTKTDALELQPMNTEYAMMGTRKADGTIYDIGHYPIPDEAFEIPVSLETTRAGNFTITATDLDLSIGSDLYFTDLQKEKSIRIDENFSYEFSTEGVAKTPGGDPFNRCSVNSPQKAKTFATADRFVITTQPRDFTEIPASVALNQNYPNPFNPTTQISYDLPQTADVRLEVYDLVGRQVATLVNQTVEAGAHTVNFDAANLSSGVYIYRLNAGNTVLSRKLTVIK